MRWTRTVADDLASLALGPGHHSTMASMLREYRFLHEEREVLEREIMTATRRLHPKRYERLTQVDGVGEVVATTFLAGKRSEGPWTGDIGRIIPTESRSHKGGW